MSFNIAREIQLVETRLSEYESLKLQDPYAISYVAEIEASYCRINLISLKAKEKEIKKQELKEKAKEMKLTSSIKRFLQFRIPTDIGGYVLTFLEPVDIQSFFESIMTLFLSGARFTQKASHITEDPLKSDLLNYFKGKFDRMTNALPAFFGLNSVYRELLFRDRPLLINYLHIPVKQRNKFLSYSRVELEKSLLKYVNDRNEMVYNTQYLPHMEKMLKVEVGAFSNIDMRQRLCRDYRNRFGKDTDLYGNQKEFESMVEDYKQEYKKSLYLPINYSPKKNECEIKVKVDKPKEKFVQVDEDKIQLRQRQEKQHEEYLEKERQKKIEKVRQEREKETKEKSRKG